MRRLHNDGEGDDDINHDEAVAGLRALLLLLLILMMMVMMIMMDGVVGGSAAPDHDWVLCQERDKTPRCP